MSSNTWKAKATSQIATYSVVRDAPLVSPHSCTCLPSPRTLPAHSPTTPHPSLAFTLQRPQPPSQHVHQRPTVRHPLRKTNRQSRQPLTIPLVACTERVDGAVEGRRREVFEFFFGVRGCVGGVVVWGGDGCGYWASAVGEREGAGEYCVGCVFVCEAWIGGGGREVVENAQPAGYCWRC